MTPVRWSFRLSLLLVVCIPCTTALLYPVTGYTWGQWSSWTACNDTCNGSQMRIRTCQDNGATSSITYCQNDDDVTQDDVIQARGIPVSYDVATRSCSTSQCTQGTWSTWTDWSVCSASCDAGVRFRGRHCENGTDCIGQVFVQQPCTIKSCVQAIDGSWGSWSTSSECSVTCGIGYTYRLRVCDSPAPSGGGADCTGTNRDFQECNLGVCQLPVDGGWTDFVDHDCTVTCGVGVVVSTRSCTNPAPAYGGKNCEGSSTTFKKCINNLCVQDGGWSDWTNYTDCGVICGFGLQRRERFCTNPAPASGGKYCEGIGLEEQECFKGDCPPDIKTCDKTMLRKALTNATTSCPPSNNTDDSIVRSFCVVPDNQISWRFGLEIHNNCEMIPLYSPVGAVQAGTAHVKKFGLMVDCYRMTLSMAITNCNNDIVVEKQNLTDTSTTYHMILFS